MSERDDWAEITRLEAENARLRAERDALRAKLATARILMRRVNTEFREVLHTSDRDTPTWREAWDLIDSIDAALKGDDRE